MTQDLPPFASETPPQDPAPAHAPASIDTLKQAMRRARLDNAERAGVLADMRIARIARLELLQEALKPLVAQVPADVDMFDIGLMPGANPRLFIDMIGFVEMGRDARLYRLLQDTRHGRTKIAESEEIETMVDAVTDYVAHRLLERDRALAADATARAKPSEGTPPRTPTRDATGRNAPASALVNHVRPRKKGALRWLGVAFAFIIDLLGSITFFTILAAIGWYLWNRMHTPI